MVITAVRLMEQLSRLSFERKSLGDLYGTLTGKRPKKRRKVLRFLVNLLLIDSRERLKEPRKIVLNLYSSSRRIYQLWIRVIGIAKLRAEQWLGL